MKNHLMSVLIVLLFLNVPLAFGQPYFHTYVASTGSNTPACGQQHSPCDSIYAAVSNTGSPQEFVEMGNRRRLERFFLPGSARGWMILQPTPRHRRLPHGSTSKSGRQPVVSNACKRIDDRA